MEGLDLEDLEGILEGILEELKGLLVGISSVLFQFKHRNRDFEPKPGTIEIHVSNDGELNEFVIKVPMNAVVEYQEILLSSINRILDEVFYELQPLRREVLDIHIVGERDKNVHQSESEYNAAIKYLNWGILTNNFNSSEVYLV